MWLQSGAYDLSGLLWLIAIAVIFVIALVALVLGAWSVSRLRALSEVVTSTSSAASSTPAVPEQNEARGMPADSEYQPRTPEALRLLDGRYANGEITRDEYLQLEADLMSTSRRNRQEPDRSSVPGSTPVGELWSR